MANKKDSEAFVANIDRTNPLNVSNSNAFDGWPVWIDELGGIADIKLSRKGPFTGIIYCTASFYI